MTRMFQTPMKIRKYLKLMRNSRTFSPELNERAGGQGKDLLGLLQTVWIQTVERVMETRLCHTVWC
jgi:hypothetical protein